MFVIQFIFGEKTNNIAVIQSFAIIHDKPFENEIKTCRA